MSQINKKSSVCGHLKSPELHIFQRKSPLVLFECVKNDVKKNESTKFIPAFSKTFSVSTQTLLFNLESSDIGIQTIFDDSIESDQSDLHYEYKWQPQPLISSIQYHHLTMSKIYQPARTYSPMATLLMGNGFFHNCRHKIYARKYQE